MFNLDIELPTIPGFNISEPTDLGTDSNIAVLAMRLGHWPIDIPPLLDDAEILEAKLEKEFDDWVLQCWKEIWNESMQIMRNETYSPS